MWWVNTYLNRLSLEFQSLFLQSVLRQPAVSSNILIIIMIHLDLGMDCHKFCAPYTTNNTQPTLGMYKTRSATTKPTVTSKFVAGINGVINNIIPKTKGIWRWCCKKVIYLQTTCKNRNTQNAHDKTKTYLKIHERPIRQQNNDKKC